MKNRQARRIAVVGAGLIGSALAGHLILSGNKVIMGDLGGAVIIDPSNPFLWHDGGVMSVKDLDGKTSGTLTAEWFPKSSVARAFSHQLAETLWLRGRREPGRWAIGYAADDNDTAWITFDIITQTGFVPIRVGALAESSPLDPGGVLFPGLLGLFSPTACK